MASPWSCESSRSGLSPTFPYLPLRGGSSEVKSTWEKRLEYYSNLVPSTWKHPYREDQSSSLKISLDLAIQFHINISRQRARKRFITSEVNLILVLTSFTQFKKEEEMDIVLKLPSRCSLSAKKMCPAYRVPASRDTVESDISFIIKKFLIQQLRQ